MAAAGDRKCAERDAAVRRLVELGKAGPLSRAQVALVAQRLGVSDRTVWRWVAQASRHVEPVMRPQFTLDEALRERLVLCRGNVSALHRELLDAAVAGGSPAPSLRTLHRAVREALTPAELATLRTREQAAVDVVDTSAAEPCEASRASQSAREPAQAVREARAAPPDPGQAATLDALVDRLRLLKAWVGNPSYDTIKSQVNKAWTAAGRPPAELAGKTTVVDCFRLGRRRLNTDLFAAIVQALHPDMGYVAQWRQALQVIGAESTAAAQVRVQDTLPPELIGFTGRASELDRLRRILSETSHASRTVVISAIEGMAGVGKTQLAIHAGHLLIREQALDRVLFVNLRGFHPDPAQPPADPGAVLDGFLRLLGVPGQQIPHDLAGRARLYRSLLGGTRTLVVLDNAADAEHVRPLLPQAPGCPVLITSRRNLIDVSPATYLAVDVFTPDEARQFLNRVAPKVPLGDDPDAAFRIARRCGHLPLALGLLAGHIRTKPGWTLTDHADWLDERHHSLRLEAGIELALDLSYRDGSVDRQRLLRLSALHPGQDFDAYAAAALLDTSVDAVRAHLGQLRDDHLLQQDVPGRYTLHDLVRTYATAKAHDEDRRAERNTALTRLFDYYLAVTATAVNSLYPSGTHLSSWLATADGLGPDLTVAEAARTWLDAERPNLVAVIAHTAGHGWPRHTIRLSRTLSRYLDDDFVVEATSVHGHAHDAARRVDDRIAQAHALASLGSNHIRLGRVEPAAEYLERALNLSQQCEDPDVQAHVLINVGHLNRGLGRWNTAADHYERALVLYQQTGDRGSMARALTNLGNIEKSLGQFDQAVDRYERAVVLCRQVGDHNGEARALNNLSGMEIQRGRYEAAVDHLHEALRLARQTGALTGEAAIIGNLGIIHARVGEPALAIGHLQQAVATFRRTGYRRNEAAVSNELADIAHVAGHPEDAVHYYTAAKRIAAEIGERMELACAHAGLGRVHHALDDLALAREHYQRALALYSDLGTPEANDIRACLGTLDLPGPNSDS